MYLRLKTKITLTVALLVLAVVAVNSWLYVARLTRQVIQQADDRANDVTQQISSQVINALNALGDAQRNGRAQATASPEEYFRNALVDNAALTSLIDQEVSIPSIYEVTIVDSGDMALVSSDPKLPGSQVLVRPPLSQLINSGFLAQLRVIRGPSQVYQVAYPFQLGPPGQQVPIGEIRVAVQTALLAKEITPALASAGWLAFGSLLISVLLAAMVSNVALAPLGRISAQLDRISRGEFDHKPLQRGDEFGQVSTKISLIGQQLRGVREIFSTLDQALGGLEDGLLLFTRDGRAVMVSPAVQTFLGLPADQLLGRRASEIFPPHHPIRQAVTLTGDDFAPVAAAKMELAGAGPDSPSRRVGVSVQVIAEGGTRMGTLVTLRDSESRERIGLQVQLGHVTKGVAHEVKNPLNSMRLWLENLKESLPPGEGVPREAVAVLDSEIDRLDSVVKRFLDFMRPPELRLEETRLDEMLNEIIGIARPQMERAKIQVETHYAELPAVCVDRALLVQALLNLVYNAVEAMPGGGHLTLGLERRGESAEIRIADTGRGIAPEHCARIFQLFFTTRPGGSGIGLASAYKTVQLHEGSIDFDSEVGRGTTFRIALPLARPFELAPLRSRGAHDVAAQKA
jgi:signal transduction histidine kinase